MPHRHPFASLSDVVTARELSVDAVLDDGWGAPFSVKGIEIEAAILVADIRSFSARTAGMTAVEEFVYVNNFFTWLSAEALVGSRAIVDKYVGDQFVVLFSTEFGNDDPIAEAIAAARRMIDHDVLDYAPRVGISHGQVVIGYVGTPKRYDCSVFGRPITEATRFAELDPEADEGEWYANAISLPASAWANQTFEKCFPPRSLELPDGTVESQETAWSVGKNFGVDVGGTSVDVVQVVTSMIRAGNFSVEDRARNAVDHLRQSGKYRPKVRG